MGEWTHLRGDAAEACPTWRQLAAAGHVQVVTQLPAYGAICRKELGWELSCIIHVSPPIVVPVVVRRRRKGLPVLAESLPYGQVGGPLTGGVLTTGEITAAARALRRCALETVLYPGPDEFNPTGWERVDFSVHQVTIAGDSGRVWSLASGGCRGAARHAARCGVDIVAVQSGALLGEVASMHARQQAARKARAYPERWLTAILGEMPDNAGLWAAIHQGRVVAALLVGWSGEAATALLSTADPEARPLKAGNLLYLRVLEALALRGLHSVDLGGSRDLPALEMFKRSLGGAMVSRPFFRYRHPGLRLYQRLALTRRN